MNLPRLTERGFSGSTGREAYIRERIKEICLETAWLMIEQVKRGNVKAIYFEQRFARRADALFPPIEIGLGDEGSVFIEGIIDRIDIINGCDEGTGSADDEGNASGGGPERRVPRQHDGPGCAGA